MQGQPQPVVLQRRDQHRHRQRINHSGHRHHIAHIRAAGGADENTIKHHQPQHHHRRAHHPWHIGAGGGAHLGGGGHQIDQPRAQGPKPQRHQAGHNRAPKTGHQRALAQLRHPARPIGLPHQRLGGKGKPIHAVACDVQKLQQHLVGRQCHIAKPRPHQQKRYKYALQQRRADQNIGVHNRHMAQAQRIKHPAPVAPGGLCKGPARQPQAQKQPAIFGQKGGKGHPRHAPAQPHDKPQIQAHIQPVHP